MELAGIHWWVWILIWFIGWCITTPIMWAMLRDEGVGIILGVVWPFSVPLVIAWCISDLCYRRFIRWLDSED